LDFVASWHTVWHGCPVNFFLDFALLVEIRGRFKEQAGSARNREKYPNAGLDFYKTLCKIKGVGWMHWGATCMIFGSSS